MTLCLQKCWFYCMKTMISAFWDQNVPPGGPKWLPGGFRGPLGRQVARWRAKGGVRNQKKILLVGPGGPLGASWGRFGLPPTPQERPGEAPGAHFLKFFGSAGAEGPKGNMCYVFYCFRVSISMLFLVLCCLPCCAPGGVANMGKP